MSLGSFHTGLVTSGVYVSSPRNSNLSFFQISLSTSPHVLPTALLHLISISIPRATVSFAQPVQGQPVTSTSALKVTCDGILGSTNRTLVRVKPR